MVRAPGGWPKHAAVLALSVSCAAPAPTVTEPEIAADIAVPADIAADIAPAPYRAEFGLYWRGRPAGLAREELAARPAARGYRFARWERWQVTRGGSPVEWETEVVIDTDAELRGERISLYRDRRLRGSALRTQSGWLVEAADEAPRRLAAGVEPAELVLLRVHRLRQARWAGKVLLAGLEFAVADLAVERRSAVQRLVLSGPAGRQETLLTLRADGTLERAEGPDVRQTRGARRRGAAPDLIELGAIRVSGRPRRAVAIERAGEEERHRLDGMPERWAALAIPDPDIDPAIRALAERVGSGASDELRALARATAAALEDDLSAGSISGAGQALASGRADCVGHAALFSALARARGFDVRLVTGYRLEGRRLIRHVWAVVRAGGAMIAIDPSFGESPIRPGRHLALTSHGSAPGEIALAAELAFAGLSGAGARFVR